MANSSDCLTHYTPVSLEYVFFDTRGWKDEDHITLAPLKLGLHCGLDYIR